MFSQVALGCGQRAACYVKRPLAARDRSAQRRVCGCRRVAAAATADGAGDALPGPMERGSSMVGKIPFPQDTETFQELMGFAGAAPERVNGRVAMWAFLVCMLTERFTHLSILQQAAQHPFNVVFLGLLISLASIIPKYTTGVALSELLDTASREGLPPKLRFFNKTHEIAVARVAMVGFAGTIAFEIWRGSALL